RLPTTAHLSQTPARKGSSRLSARGCRDCRRNVPAARCCSGPAQRGRRQELRGTAVAEQRRQAETPLPSCPNRDRRTAFSPPEPPLGTAPEAPDNSCSPHTSGARSC